MRSIKRLPTLATYRAGLYKIKIANSSHYFINDGTVYEVKSKDISITESKDNMIIDNHKLLLTKLEDNRLIFKPVVIALK